MTAVVITASLDRDWVRALAALRARGVAAVVVSLDAPAFERRRAGRAAASGESWPPRPGAEETASEARARSATPSPSTS